MCTNSSTSGTTAPRAVIDVPSGAPPSSVRTGDIILGIDGEAVDAKDAVDMLRRPPKVFTLDVERVFVM